MLSMFITSLLTSLTKRLTLMTVVNPTYNCPICQSTASTSFMTGCRDLLYRCPGEWELRECTNCQVIYSAPAPNKSEILQYYPANYSPYNPTTPLRGHLLGNLLRQWAMLPYRLRFGNPDWSERPFGQGKLLDVG